MVTNKRTWFAHMFRTQGGDFGFPYPLACSDQKKARQYSQELWKGNRWHGQVRPLSWLIEHFAPVPGWDAPAVSTQPSKGVVYYSDCQADERILSACRAQLLAATNGHRLVAVTLAPVELQPNIVFPEYKRGHLTMFKQILAGLEACDADIVFLAEHDVLYPSEHFEFMPYDPGKVYYNENVWKVDAQTGRCLHYRCRQTSGLCAYRDVLLAHYRERVKRVEREGFSRRMGFEPGTHHRAERVDDLTSEGWMSTRPLVDIRHGKNLPPSRWKREEFRDQRYGGGWTEGDEVPGWGKPGEFLWRS